MKRIAFITAALLLAAACGGPRVPLNIGVKEYPTDVLFGGLVVAKGQQLPPVAPPAAPIVAIEQPASAPSPTPRPECPKADPLAPILNETRPRPPAPPTAGALEFRNTGSVSLAGIGLSYQDVNLQRTIASVRRETDAFSFDVVTRSPAAGGAEVTTTFHVVTRAALADLEGIFVSEERTRFADGRVSESIWVPEIKLLAFPSAPGASWDVVSTEQNTQTVQSFHAEIKKTSKVDACGTPMAAWQVDVTNGLLLGQNVNLTFTASYHFGNQYGGLVLMDAIDESGTVGAPPQELKVRNVAIVNDEPKAVK